jgi:hypothetical protein
MKLKDLGIYKITQRYRDTAHTHVMVGESRADVENRLNEYRQKMKFAPEVTFEVRCIGYADTLVYWGAGE